MRNLLQQLWSDDSGQGMVEYALIIALVAIGLIAVFLYLRNETGDVIDTAADSLAASPKNSYVPTP